MLVLIGVIGLGGIWAMDSAVTEVENNTEISDTVQQNGTWEQVGTLSDVERYSEPEVVENESRELAESEYSWNRTEGTIRVHNQSYNATSGNYENVSVAGVIATSLPDNGGAWIKIAGGLTKIPGWMAFVVAGGVLMVGIRGLNKSRQRGGFP